MKNPCEPDPCVNGVCTSNFTDFKCTCPADYTGTTCGNPKLTCAEEANNQGILEQNLCKHQGVCVNDGDSHTCECAEGFTGSYCEADIDYCDSSPCVNAIECVDGVNGYVFVLLVTCMNIHYCDVVADSSVLVNLDIKVLHVKSTLMSVHQILAKTVELVMMELAHSNALALAALKVILYGYNFQYFYSSVI